MNDKPYSHKEDNTAESLEEGASHAQVPSFEDSTPESLAGSTSQVQEPVSSVASEQVFPITDRYTGFMFLLLLALFCAAGLLFPDRDFSPQENRYLTRKPVLSLAQLVKGEYMAVAEEYVTDQFPFRDFWVSCKAMCQRWSGQKENNGVYFARDAYLIGKPHEVDPGVTARNLATVQEMAAAGYDVALLVVPMAAEILQDKLPGMAYTREHAALLALLRQEVPDLLVDVENLLHQAAADEQVFFRTDHHWTMTGAYEAYRAYMDWLGKEALPLDSYDSQVVSRDFYGTLWSKNSLPGIPPDEICIYSPKETLSAAVSDYELEFFDGTDRWTVRELYQREYLEQKDKYAVFLGQNRPLAVIRQTDGRDAEPSSESSAEASSEPSAGSSETQISPALDFGDSGTEDKNNKADNSRKKLLLFKDSYAHSFAPFLLPHFDEIHLIDLRYWRQDPIAYMEENGIQQTLFLYNADDFSSDRTISQLSAYLAQHLP